MPGRSRRSVVLDREAFAVRARNNARTFARPTEANSRDRACPRLFGLLLAALVVSVGLAPAPRTPRAAAASAAVADTRYTAGLLAMMNEERATAGLDRFELSADRTTVASLRALDMAARGYFAHVNPEGIGPAELLAEHAIGFELLGENIARSTYPVDQVLDIVHRTLMASAPHRANVLDPRFRQVGIAAALIGEMYYFAIVFTD